LPENTRAAWRLASIRTFRCGSVPEVDTVEVSGSSPPAARRGTETQIRVLAAAGEDGGATVW
jgi:hypothetical protein